MSAEKEALPPLAGLSDRFSVAATFCGDGEGSSSFYRLVQLPIGTVGYVHIYMCMRFSRISSDVMMVAMLIKRRFCDPI